MPLINVTAPKGILKKKQVGDLMNRISDAVLEAEGAPLDYAGACALTWSYYREAAEDGVFIGGQNIDQPPLLIEVTTPQGALDAEREESLVAAIGVIVDDIVGPYEGALNQWTLLREVKDGNWSGSGQIFPLAGIQAAMNIKAA